MKKVTMQEFGAELEKRRAEYQVKYGHSVDEVMPRNAGNHRTESKKALLQAIKEAGGKW